MFIEWTCVLPLHIIYLFSIRTARTFAVSGCMNMICWLSYVWIWHVVQSWYAFSRSKHNKEEGGRGVWWEDCGFVLRICLIYCFYFFPVVFRSSLRAPSLWLSESSFVVFPGFDWWFFTSILKLKNIIFFYLMDIYLFSLYLNGFGNLWNKTICFLPDIATFSI